MRTFILSVFAIMAISLLFNGFDAGKQEIKTGISDIAVPGYP